MNNEIEVKWWMKENLFHVNGTSLYISNSYIISVAV